MTFQTVQNIITWGNQHHSWYNKHNSNNTMICMLLDSRHLILRYHSTPKYLVRRSIVLCHHMMDGQFKNGRVLMDYSRLTESDYSRLAEPLRTIQDWPSPDYSKMAESLRTIQSWPCPHRPPSSTPRQYASFIITSPIMLGLSDPA
jgi:hypothetical protein